MKAVTSEQMYVLEQSAFNKSGLPSLLYMERAGSNVAAVIIRALDKRGGSYAAVVCGPGNNGGDGYVAAGYVRKAGYRVCIVQTDTAKTEDAVANCIAAVELGIEFEEITNLKSVVQEADIVCDAVFGIGLTRDISGCYADIIETINTYAKYVVAVDMPSGICSNTGRVMGAAVRADETVTFALAKLGHIMFPGAEYTGVLNVRDIQINTAEAAYSALIPEKNDIKGFIPKRPRDSHKGMFGTLAIVGGSDEMPGAVCLAAEAAYRTGCGLVRAIVTAGAARALTSRVPECVCRIMPSDNGFLSEKGAECLPEILQDADCILIGPGMGVTSGTKAYVRAALETRANTVIDADALNVLDPSLFFLLTERCLITPHPKEMSRLTGEPVASITEAPLAAAAGFTEKYGSVTLLKGARTITAARGAHLMINTTGCSALAKAGTGDVLAGIAASLVTQGQNAAKAAAAAAYIHGKAGEKAAEKYSEYGVLARDIVRFIPAAMKELFTEDTSWKTY